MIRLHLLHFELLIKISIIHMELFNVCGIFSQQVERLVIKGGGGNSLSYGGYKKSAIGGLIWGGGG